MVTVLACGRLTAQKDYDTLLRAFALVHSMRDARLVILGEGDERDVLEATVGRLGVADAVSMPGFVSNPHEYMAGCDVFVLSSAWEGLPNVLIEAMACGAPVVATDCAGDGPLEILEDGRWGRLVPVGNHQALAEAILGTLDSPIDATARAMDFAVETAVDGYLEALT